MAGKRAIRGVVEVTRIIPITSLKESVAFAILKGKGYLGKVKVLSRENIERFSQLVGKGKVLVVGDLEPHPKDFKKVFLLLRGGYLLGTNGEELSLGITLDGVFLLGPWELRYTGDGVPFIRGYVRFRTRKGTRGSLPFVYFGGERLVQMVEEESLKSLVYISGNLEEGPLYTLRIRVSTLVPLRTPGGEESPEVGAQEEMKEELDLGILEFPEELPY